MTDNFTIAKKFGQSLDKDDFETTAKLLSHSCIYKIGKKTLRGPTEIVSSYEQNMIEGRQKLDSLEWGKSRATKINEKEYIIHFTDYLTHKSLTYTHKCQQKLKIEKGLVTHIVHVDDEEEQNRLNDFYRKVGILKK